MDAGTFAAGIVLGALLGALVAALWLRARTPDAGKFQAIADAALRSSQGAFLDAARSTLDTVRAQMSGELAQRQTAIEGVVRPLGDTLGRLEAQVREIEAGRQRMFGGIEEQLAALSRETTVLANALRAPQSRGRWGEITLRRVAELSGMVRYCDFYEQETSDANGGRIRPDMTVRLPGGRSLIVDAKVPLNGYLEAMAASDDASRRAAIDRHGQQVARHVDQLASKQYWSQFQPAPEMVVLFLPGDHFFSAALEACPSLIEDSIARKVLLATPVTLISVLKGIAYGWRQEQLAENAEQIRQVAAEFYERVQTYSEYFSDTGNHLEKAVEAYNRAVGSWEARLLPSLRRMRELGATSGSEAVVPSRIDLETRSPRNIGTDDSA